MDLKTPQIDSSVPINRQNPWENGTKVEHDIIPTSYLGRSSLGLFGKSVEILDRLHEVTTTALHLQVHLSSFLFLYVIQTQLKRDYLQRESLLSSTPQYPENSMTSCSMNSESESCNMSSHPVYTLGNPFLFVMSHHSSFLR